MSKIKKEQVIEAEEKATGAMKSAYEIAQAFAVQECPLSVGDIVECVGSSHKGKMMIINAICKPKYKYDGDWAVWGYVMKKDGTSGSLVCSFTHSDYNKKKGVEE